jgi:hypothetical protein
MKKLLLLITGFTITNVFAVVTTYDTATASRTAADTAEATNTMVYYTSQVASTFNKMADAKSAVSQLQSLKGLQKLQAGETLCNLCSATDNKKLADYSASINDDLCSQFGYAYKNLTGITKTFSNLQDIVGMFNKDPRTAALALQQASITAAQTTNSTLAQMQVMQAQMVQKQLADEKRQQQTGVNTVQTLQTQKPVL